MIDITYNFWVIALSFAIASFASYVALDLAKRVRTTDQFLGRVWWGAGSAAMGTGIWSMHFVGMQAAAFPFAVGFGYALTALSWVAAVAVSAIALSIASRTRLSLGRWVFGSLAMGAGICSMHYIGMAAMHMEPGIRWSVGWVLVGDAPDMQRIATVPLIESQVAPVTWRDWFMLNDMKLPPRPRLSFDRGALSISAAVDEMGVALETTRFAEKEIARGDLVEFGTGTFKQVARETHFLSQRLNERHVEKVRVFREWLLIKVGLSAEIAASTENTSERH